MTRQMRFSPRAAFVAGMAVVLALVIAWRALEPRVALAQVPDSGAQRNEMIIELKQLNEQVKTLSAVVKEIREQTKPPKTPDRKP
jgi:hypothetical protein